MGRSSPIWGSLAEARAARGATRGPAGPRKKARLRGYRQAASLKPGGHYPSGSKREQAFHATTQAGSLRYLRYYPSGSKRQGAFDAPIKKAGPQGRRALPLVFIGEEASQPCFPRQPKAPRPRRPEPSMNKEGGRGTARST